MKNLFILICIVFSLASCTENKQTIQKINLPVEVERLKELQSYDTILQIQTNNRVYQFTNQKEYIGSYEKVQEVSKTSDFILIFIACVIFFIIIITCAFIPFTK